ncbi:hypothetical protein ACLB1T_26845 [Escherichia coli]
MHQENTMPSTPDIGFFIHRPKYHLTCETITGNDPAKAQVVTGV